MSVFATDEHEYVSFDGSTRRRVRRVRPDRYRFFDHALGQAGRFLIPRGAGLSYAAASFGAGATTVEHRWMNRALELDEERRLVRVEAGMSLGELHRLLGPRGLYVAVQPGHPSITVGGCVATDAHGKAHTRFGTFSSQVRGLTLAHPDHGILELGPRHHAHIFDLTCGGYGLTGNILTVELAVESTPGPLTADVLPVASLSELPAALEAAEREWTFVHSWHDLRPRQSRPFGPGYLQVSRFADGSTPEDQRTETAMTLEAGRRAFLPMSLLRGPTVRAMNAVHGFRLARDAREGARTVSLFDSQFPIAGLELYFYLFGRRGFGEHQVVVPHASFADWAERLHSHLRQWPIPITLGSAKTFGAPQKLLSFSGDGVCFAINIPRIRGARKLLEFLDNLTVEVGGRPNLIKDSRLPREVVDATYLEADAFRAGRREFDPLRRYRSELSERLAL